MKLISFLQDGTAPALVSQARAYSGAEVRAAVADRTYALACKGVSRGHRLVVLHDHDEEAIFLLAAASAIGLHLVMPYSLRKTTAREWLDVVSAARPDHLVDLRTDSDKLHELSASAPSVLMRKDLLRHAPAPRREVLIVRGA